LSKKSIVNMKMGVEITGHITVEKWSDNGLPPESYEFDNLILDVGWAEIWSRFPCHNRGGLPRYLYLGTSSVEPAPSDPGLLAVSTTLAGKLAISEVYGGLISAESVYSSVRLQFDYTQGEAQGVWLELGLAYGSTYTNPFNRALFRDENGDPMSITVLSDEYLRVYVELRMHFPPGNRTQAVLLDGNEFTATISYHDVSGYSTGATDSGANFWGSGFSLYADMTWHNVFNDKVLNPNGTAAVVRTFTVNNANRSCLTTFFIPKTEGTGSRCFKRLFIGSKQQNRFGLLAVNFSPFVSTHCTLTKPELAEMDGSVFIQWGRLGDFS
jgi:hypothetical protein